APEVESLIAGGVSGPVYSTPMQIVAVLPGLRLVAVNIAEPVLLVMVTVPAPKVLVLLLVVALNAARLDCHISVELARMPTTTAPMPKKRPCRLGPAGEPDTRCLGRYLPPPGVADPSPFMYPQSAGGGESEGFCVRADLDLRGRRRSTSKW